MSSFLARVEAALRTVTVAVVISLYVLVVGSLGYLVARLQGRPDLLYQLGYYGNRLGFWIAGLRYVADGTEHIRRDRPAIYAMNHSSNLEPPVIYMLLRGVFPRLQILYKSALRRLPVLGSTFDFAGFVPIDRRNRVQSDAAIARAVEQSRAGNNFVVFPEGTRSRTGELLPFKKGAFIMAIRAQAPIVPVAILGSAEAMRKGSILIWPTTMQVEIGAPIDTAGLALEDRDALIARVYRQMSEQLERLRERRARM